MLTVRKNAIDARAAGTSLEVPLNDSRIEMTIIERPIPNAPNIMGFLRPRLSEPSAGTREPITNARLMHPPTTSAVFRASPTLV